MHLFIFFGIWLFSSIGFCALWGLMKCSAARRRNLYRRLKPRATRPWENRLCG